jgi:hypothetical protein
MLAVFYCDERVPVLIQVLVVSFWRDCKTAPRTIILRNAIMSSLRNRWLLSDRSEMIPVPSSGPCKRHVLLQRFYKSQMVALQLDLEVGTPNAQSDIRSTFDTTAYC